VPVVSARQLAFQTLRAIQAGAYADIALDRTLTQTPLAGPDRRLLTELVYGCVRRQRTLDALIDCLATKTASQQPPDLRLLLHLGFYQLRYLDHIPAAAAVTTTVDLAKANRMAGLSGLINGILRTYLRTPPTPPPIPGITHSYPDWIIALWQSQLPPEEVDAIATWFNQSPTLDLRINPLRTSLSELEAALQAANLSPQRLPGLPQALRLTGPVGPIQALPGFAEGWWMVQDASAQLVVHLLDPQPGETIIDACAAPGGKTLHIAECMGDRGQIWACDRTASRLKKLQDNATRLGMQSIQIRHGDSCQMPDLVAQADRVLVDAPCSGLGTLHRHADARWRQNPDRITDLIQQQQQLLEQTAAWVKPGGCLVYSTCTLNPGENENVIAHLLQNNPGWIITPPPSDSLLSQYVSPQGTIQVWPHRANMDGFFMVRLQRATA
jgi:16S rRNA (cytosine967-C5)-methyltransferase